MIEQAYRETRILLTEDKDFGWHVFASHAASAGVILIRFPSQARSSLARSELRVEKRSEPTYGWVAERSKALEKESA